MSGGGETPHAVRTLAVDGVRWTVVAEEHRPRFAQASLTFVWFIAGQATRVAYATRPAREVLEWPERELRALFDLAVPASAS